MARKSKKMLPKEEGFVFETSGGAVSSIDTTEFKEESSSFDAHMITGKIMDFGKMLTGIPLYDYQEKIAYSIIYSVITFNGDVLTVLLSRQSGKSETMAFVIDTLAILLPLLAPIFPELEQFKSGFRIGLFAPQSDQVVTTYSRALTRLNSANAEMVMSDPDISTYLESSARLELSNGSYLAGQVASKQSKIESKTYDLVIIEEAQDVDDLIVEKSIEPMVSATGGTIVKVGTTGMTKNHFYKEIQHNKNEDRKRKDHRVDLHHEYNYKAIIESRKKQFEKDGKRFHLNYENDIMRKIKRRGADDPAFKLAYALIWSLETGMLITDEKFEKLLNKKMGLQEATLKDYVAAGLDIAKNPASTVLTILKVTPDQDDIYAKPKKQLLAWVDLGGLSYEAQHHALLDAIATFNISIMYVDNTGVGKPVCERLMYSCGEYVNIIPFTFTTQSKSDMWYNLESEIITDRLTIPANKKTVATPEFRRFEDQMKNCQKYYNGPYMVCEKSDGYFDDYVDSLGLACLAANEEPVDTYEVEESMNPLYEQVLNNRKIVNRNSHG